MIILKHLLKKAQEGSDAVEVLFKEPCIYCVEEFVDVFSIEMCVMAIGLGHSLH